jgi:ATP-dependent protease ClpP protease subunit
MKKLIASVIMSLVLVFGGITSTQSFELISHRIDKKTDHLYSRLLLTGTVGTIDQVNLMKNTTHLKSGDTLHLYLNTPGGDAYALIGMIEWIEKLKDRGVHIITEVSGMAMSAGAFLWITGDERIASERSTFMFHTVSVGGKTSIEECGQLVDERKDSCIFILEHLNNVIRQYMLDITHDVELTNKLLKFNKTNGNYNFYTGKQIIDMGLTTK